MKIIFLNEGAFGTYKNKSDKEARKEKLKKETSKIAKRAARNDIKKFYGKVLMLFAAEARKAISKTCQFNDCGANLNFDVAATFDVNTSVGYGGNITDTHNIVDYENIAGSLYSTKECLDNNHESLVIPIEVGSDSGFIEQSIVNKNVLYKTLVKVFRTCIEKVEMKIDIPIGFSKPKEFKFLLLSSYCASPWGYLTDNNEPPPIEFLYKSIFDGTYDGSLDDIASNGRYGRNINANTKYVYFVGSNEKDLDTRSGFVIHSVKDISDIVKAYPKIIYNPRHWESIHIITEYDNSKNKEFFDFIKECTKNNIKITTIDFRDESNDYNGKTRNSSVNDGVDRALNVVKIVDNLKTVCPELVNTDLEFPNNMASGGFMVKCDKKFLAVKADSRSSLSYTTLGKNIGISAPKGKFIRNIYALDINSPSLKKDLVNMIIKSANNQSVRRGYNNIDISGKYEKAIVEGVADHMIKTFNKLLSLRPHCCAGNYLLFCSYTQDVVPTIDEIIRINFDELKEVKKKLTIQASYDFKLACAQGFNPKYSLSKSMQNSGKSYEYIAGKKTRIEIPV